MDANKKNIEQVTAAIQLANLATTSSSYLMDGSFSSTLPFLSVGAGSTTCRRCMLFFKASVHFATFLWAIAAPPKVPVAAATAGADDEGEEADVDDAVAALAAR